VSLGGAWGLGAGHRQHPAAGASGAGLIAARLPRLPRLTPAARRPRPAPSPASYPSLSEEEEDAIAGACDALLEEFSRLALSSTRRAARLCAAPGALAIWALESLKEQAEAALTFGALAGAE
jgi:hypothetical protein